jgi:hypothetical protein
LHLTPSNYQELVRAASRRSKREIEAMLVERFHLTIPTKLQLTVSPDLQAKLQRATDLMRHRNPSGDAAVVIEAALDLLIARLEKQVLCKTDRPQTKPRPSRAGYVPNAVRRAVFARDDGQCTFVDKSGERCPARGFVQIDHRHARGKGGSGKDPTTLRVLCQQHNLLHAEETYGRDYVRQRIRARQHARAKSRASPAPTG